MMDQERAIFKAKEQFEQVLDLIQDAVDEGKVIDEVERDLWQNRLRIGQTLLQGYVDSHGSGDLGQALEHEGKVLRRLERYHERRYVGLADIYISLYI